jgi:hypothetical protein
MQINFIALKKYLKLVTRMQDQFNLEPNDKIFVYENINYKNSFTYRVEGEVFNRPGTYPITSMLV